MPHTYQGPFREGNMEVIRACGVTRICIQMAADEQVLDQIIPEPYAFSLANGILREYVQQRSITISMVERWVQEFVASARARLEEEKARARSREIVFTSVRTDAQHGQLQAIGLHRKAYTAQLIMAHSGLASWVSRGLVSVGMLHHWLDEAIAEEAARPREEKEGRV